MKQLIIFALVCLPLLCACGGSQQKEADATYKTLTVTQSDQILKSDYTATLRGRQYVEIRPQVSGIITRICINEGDPVHKGQTLFIIDQVPYKAALETAVANVKSAEAKLATAKLTADSKAELYKEQIVSEFDLQTARNEQAAAEAALAQAKAQEVNARNDLSYTEVKSPVNGVASMIPYRVGALVNSSITEPLVTVSDDSEVYAYFSMTENQILDFVQQYGSLKKAIENMDEVELTMSNGKTYSHVGKVDAISGTVDEGTGAVGLRAVTKVMRIIGGICICSSSISVSNTTFVCLFKRKDCKSTYWRIYSTSLLMEIRSEVVWAYIYFRILENLIKADSVLSDFVSTSP